MLMLLLVDEINVVSVAVVVMITLDWSIALKGVKTLRNKSKKRKNHSGDRNWSQGKLWNFFIAYFLHRLDVISTTSSVTRLVHFWKFLATNLGTKVPQILDDCPGYFKSITFEEKLWTTFGTTYGNFERLFIPTFGHSELTSIILICWHCLLSTTTYSTMGVVYSR